MSAYGNAGCEATSVSYNALETELLMWLVTTENSVKALTSAVIDPTLTAKSELIDLRSRLEKLLDLAESGSAGVAKRIVKIEDEIARVEDGIKNYITPTPLGDSLTSMLKTLEKHEELKVKGGPELTSLRLELQTAIRRLFAKIVLLKDVHESKYGYKYREVVVYGPIAEQMAKWIKEQKELLVTNRRMVSNAEMVQNYKLTDDDGVVVQYELEQKGFQAGNIRGRRTKKATPKF